MSNPAQGEPKAEALPNAVARRAKKRKTAAPLSTTPETKRPTGRPPKLSAANPEHLKQIEGLGRIHATIREAASAMMVSTRTLQDWLDQELPEHLQPEDGSEVWIVKDVFERGVISGKVGLRRTMFAAAFRGNITMMIWLGKQHLGMSDKVTTAETDVENITDIEYRIVDPSS